jgi:hypothetical protein
MSRATDGESAGTVRETNKANKLVWALLACALLAIYIGGLVALARSAVGADLGDVAALGVLFVPAVAFVVRCATCWVSVSPTTVVIRNPIRRHVLPVARVQRFIILPGWRLPYMAAAVLDDGRLVRCWGLPDGDEPAQRRLLRLNRALGVHDTAIEGAPEPGVKPPRSWRARLAYGLMGAVLLVSGIWRMAQQFEHPPAAPVSAADRRTCQAVSDLISHWTAWVATVSTENLAQSFQDLEHPPIQNDIARLARANAATADKDLKGDVSTVLAADHRGDAPSDYEAPLLDASGQCGFLGIDMPDSTTTTTK